MITNESKIGDTWLKQYERAIPCHIAWLNKEETWVASNLCDLKVTETLQPSDKTTAQKLYSIKVTAVFF